MRGIGGMGGMGNMMSQIQKMQARFKESQKELEATVFTGESASGAVKVEIYGNHVIKGFKINPEVVDTDDMEMLEDLLKVACDNAHAKITEACTQMTNNAIPPAMRHLL